MSSIINNWDPYYFRRINELLNGTYALADSLEGNSSGVVLIGLISEDVPDSVRAEAEALRDAIAAGTYHAFTGPINNQDGNPCLAGGETPPKGDVMGMGFYVEGIVGEIPQKRLIASGPGVGICRGGMEGAPVIGAPWFCRG